MLRDLIKEKHDEAENKPFVKYLLSGKIAKRDYAVYLYNQCMMYNMLEKRADSVMSDIQEAKRADRIFADLRELEEYDLPILPSTVAYIDYVQTAELNDQDLMAHVYVRHMGDMFGGQMIKKVVPGSGTMYDFENRSELIKKIRDKLCDDMAEEANVVFDFAIGLFEDLEYELDIPVS
jgi:heme oxygenase